jgi:hypothetical protein
MAMTSCAAIVRLNGSAQVTLRHSRHGLFG